MSIRISINKALAGLDQEIDLLKLFKTISIHKALAGLDSSMGIYSPISAISIHKALAGLDRWRITMHTWRANFNPQGPRGPRQKTTADFVREI